MYGRLNSFQKTMLQWNDMHPYNAVHVVRIPGVLNAEWLRLSLNSRLEGHGLTHLKLNRGANTYVYHGGRVDCDVKIILGEQDPISALRAEIEQQLNTPFQQRGRCNPFRFFAVAAKDSFFEVWFTSIPLRTPSPSGFCCVISRSVAWTAVCPSQQCDWTCILTPTVPVCCAAIPRLVARKLLALPAQIRNLKQSHRPGCRDAQDMKNSFSLFSLGPERLRRLVVAGKSWELTVNDVLLALLMKSVAPLSGGRTHANKRRKISVGCIVNLRRELGIDSARTFGLFLGSFTVTHTIPEAISLRELSGDIRRQTLVIKRHQLYLAMPMDWALSRFMSRFFSLEQHKKFYQKYYPLWGGLTNMNLNSLWEQSNEDGPMDYFRGVSTGPVTLLCFGDHGWRSCKRWLELPFDGILAGRHRASEESFYAASGAITAAILIFG